MEDELMMRDPRDKLIRRDDELHMLERKLQDASERLDLRESLLSVNKRQSMADQLADLERLGNAIDDLKNRRNKCFLAFNDAIPAAVA